MKVSWIPFSNPGGRLRQVTVPSVVKSELLRCCCCFWLKTFDVCLRSSRLQYLPAAGAGKADGEPLITSITSAGPGLCIKHGAVSPTLLGRSFQPSLFKALVSSPPPPSLLIPFPPSAPFLPHLPSSVCSISALKRGEFITLAAAVQRSTLHFPPSPRAPCSQGCKNLKSGSFPCSLLARPASARTNTSSITY